MNPFLIALVVLAALAVAAFVAWRAMGRASEAEWSKYGAGGPGISRERQRAATSAAASAAAIDEEVELDESTVPFQDIAPEAARALIAERGDLVLLDVRTRGEVRGGIIAGAIHIPMNDVPMRARELPKDAPILVYCAHGMRSAGVCEFLARTGRTELYNLDGGIAVWGAELVQAT